MRTTIELPPETVREVIMTCVVLHNILISQYQGQPAGQQPGEDDGDDVPGDCGLIGGAAGGGQDKNYQIFQKQLISYACYRRTNPMPNITCTHGQTDKPHAKHNLFRWTNRQIPCQT